MKKIYFVFFILFYLHHVQSSRVRLCVSTSNYEKLQPQCVFCQSRSLGKTLELCTGSPDYSSNVTYQQAKCLISVCSRNQLPVDMLQQQQTNQFAEMINMKNNNKMRPIAHKQPLLHSPHHSTMLTSTTTADTFDQQNVETDNELMNNRPTSTMGDLSEQQQLQDELMNGKPNINSSGLQDVGTMTGTMATNTMNWPSNTSPTPMTNNKFIFKRKPLFRFWPFFG